MKLSISETAKLTGISVRTLHYYDEIHLLAPSQTTEAGYRSYDDEALATLQQILFYRELDVPLKEIKSILSMPDYNRKKALKAHKELLMLKQERLGRLIELADRTMRGEEEMSFDEFSMADIETAKEKYKEEACKRWGDTKEYAQSAKKTDGYTKDQWKEATEAAEQIFRGFAKCKADGESYESGRAQALVAEWKQHITRYYYDCTNQILAGLGEMYTGDDRFRDNIDRFGPETAQFMSDAIRIFCTK